MKELIAKLFKKKKVSSRYHVVNIVTGGHFKFTVDTRKGVQFTHSIVEATKHESFDDAVCIAELLDAHLVRVLTYESGRVEFTYIRNDNDGEDQSS